MTRRQTYNHTVVAHLSLTGRIDRAQRTKLYAAVADVLQRELDIALVGQGFTGIETEHVRAFYGPPPATPPAPMRFDVMLKVMLHIYAHDDGAGFHMFSGEPDIKPLLTPAEWDWLDARYAIISRTDVSAAAATRLP